MKKIIPFLLIISLACNNKQSTYHSPKADTIKTLLLFSLPDKKELKYDVGFRIIKDSLKLVTVDSSTIKKMWVIDTSYYVPYQYQVKDSANKPKVDSAGKAVMGLIYLNAPRSAIFIDGGKDIDQIIKKYYSQDTLKKKGNEATSQ